MQETIGQRIKFLLDHFKLSARKFSREIGVAENNTQNYLPPSNREPGARYLELILIRFESVSAVWLLTGKSAPFLASTNENGLAAASNQETLRGSFPVDIQGTANQLQGGYSGIEWELLKGKLAIAEKDVESLQAQLQMKDVVIAAKDETISLLREGYTRPS